MLNQLWSSAQQDPPLAIAFMGIGFVVCWALGLSVIVWLDGRKAGVTTAAQLRQDAHTAQRRAWVKKLQVKFGQRRAS